MSRKQQDPFLTRETQKYPFPIPSREYILAYLRELGYPATFHKLIEDFELTKPEEEEGLRFRLRAMVRDGQLMRDRRKRYCLIDKVHLIPGKVIAHPDGFGFVVPDNKSPDLYLSAREMMKVFHQDRVLVQERGRDRRGRREAIIHEVIERNTQQLVGRFFQEQGITLVEPDHKRINQAIQIPSDQTAGARHGQIVLVEIIAQPGSYVQPIGRVIEILGEHMAPGMEIDIAIHSYGIPHKWSNALLEEAQQFQHELSAEDYLQRADLRHLPFVTIDGEDAKDFDDAVYCVPRTKGGWHLYVAIADVSHYVQPNTHLDQEAQTRGNSVYFPGRVIPMLPEILSNELCSLCPKVDRLAMVCEILVTDSGKLGRYRFYPAVIHSKARLTYTQVAEVFSAIDRETSHDLLHNLSDLAALYAMFKVLYQARQERGALEFETTETKIIFDTEKKIKKIAPLIRNDAHRMIEECMLLANVAAAKFLAKNKIPILYRVHAAPDKEKIADLRQFLGELSLSLKGGRKPQATDYRYLLDDTKQRLDHKLIQTIILRSMAQAEYQADNVGHFALAYPAYTHFTSPIRRYPDLLVHRAIRYLLDSRQSETFPYTQEWMQKTGEHCSQTERRADEATRDVIAWLKCEYMLDKVGQEFDGVIASVTNFGIFVELKAIYVEGLVHITSLDNDYYQYDPIKHRLRGERSGTTYTLGDPIRVLVARVDLGNRQIDFELA